MQAVLCERGHRQRSPLKNAIGAIRRLGCSSPAMVWVRWAMRLGANPVASQRHGLIVIDRVIARVGMAR